MSTSTSPSTSTKPPLSFEALEDRFPRQTVDIGNGETLSYVDCNLVGTQGDTTTNPHNTLLMIPGYACDSKFSAFTLAQYDAFQDHRILAVDPRGFGESTMHTENWSHNDNAKDLKLFLDKLGVEQTMVMGYSTGGGAAAWLALLYPERISAVFLLCALPLNGMRTPLMTNGGKLTGQLLQTKQDAIEYTDKFMTPAIHSPDMHTFRASVGYTCLDASKLPPDTDRGLQLYHKAAMQHRSRASSLYANNAFNITPIQTPMAPPTTILSQLSCPMMVLHGANDALIKTRHVRAVTELAMVERWAPKGTLSYHEIPDCGHMFMYDNPHQFQWTYRQAYERHVLHHKKAKSVHPKSSL